LKMLNKLAAMARNWKFRLRAVALESGLFRLIQSQLCCNLDKILTGNSDLEPSDVRVWT
jgi:hypothetical protein